MHVLAGHSCTAADAAFHANATAWTALLTGCGNDCMPLRLEPQTSRPHTLSSPVLRRWPADAHWPNLRCAMLQQHAQRRMCGLRGAAGLLRRTELCTASYGLSRRLELTGLRFLLGHRLRRGVPKLLGPRARRRATKCATTDTVASPAVSLASGSTVVANASLQRGGCESLRRQLSLERAPYELREHVWLKDISAGRPRLRCAVPARELAQRRLRQLRGAVSTPPAPPTNASWSAPLTPPHRAVSPVRTPTASTHSKAAQACRIRRRVTRRMPTSTPTQQFGLTSTWFAGYSVDRCNCSILTRPALLIARMSAETYLGIVLTARRSTLTAAPRIA